LGSNRGLVNDDPILVKSPTKSEVDPLMVELQVVPPEVSEKNIDGFEAICCSAEQAEICDEVSVLQLVGVTPVNAP
jgi:hypothetical protein